MNGFINKVLSVKYGCFIFIDKNNFLYHNNFMIVSKDKLAFLKKLILDKIRNNLR